MKSDPGHVLSEARAAFGAKDYLKSLERYQWFFDNSILIDRSYYGVRLSYCLSGWAELGKEYPPAWKALVEKKQKALMDFKSTSSRSFFHDFSSISHYLQEEADIYKEFLPIHESNRGLAEKLFTFVYEYCASQELWDICREYLGNGYKKYLESLETFDHMMELVEKRKMSVDDSIYLDAVEAFEKECLWILNMLHYINVSGEYESAISKIQSDMSKRGYVKIFNSILEKAPYKAL